MYIDRVEYTFRHVRDTLIGASSELPFSELYLFGSAARGEFKLGSDLDFLLVVDDPAVRKRVSVGVEFLDVRSDTGPVPVDVIVRTKDYIENSKDIFTCEVRRDRKLLWKRG